jgi:hypothetical protein
MGGNGVMKMARWGRAGWGAAVIAAVIAGAGGCTRNDPAETAIASARAAIATLRLKLRQRLQKAMGEGPAKALEVCANEAQAIRAEVSHDTGVALGRASLRLRTPADAPPAWVGAWLAELGERKVEGVVGFARIDETPAGRVARVLEPIGVEKGCLTCHGPAETLTPAVREALGARYPNDAATGYAEGDLRGAFWAEKPLP